MGTPLASCSLPCWEGGQAAQAAGRAECWTRSGTPGNGGPGDCPSSGAGAEPAQCPARCFTPSCPDLGAKGSAVSQALVALWEMLPPNAWAAGCRVDEFPRSSGSDTGVPIVTQVSPHWGAQQLHLPGCWLHLEPHCGPAVFVGGVSFSLFPKQPLISFHLSHLQIPLP